MRVIIAGPRDYWHVPTLETAIAASGFEITEAINGGAPGVDTIGREWAVRNAIPPKDFPADWKRFGRRAGPIRNGQMADYAEAAIVLWDGQSRGSGDMIAQARAKGLKVFVWRFDLGCGEWFNSN